MKTTNQVINLSHKETPNRVRLGDIQPGTYFYVEGILYLMVLLPMCFQEIAEHNAGTNRYLKYAVNPCSGCMVSFPPEIMVEPSNIAKNATITVE